MNKVESVDFKKVHHALYEAQAVVEESQTGTSLRYSASYIDKQGTIKRVALKAYNVLHTVFTPLFALVQKIASAIGRCFSFATSWIWKRLCPFNPITGRHQFFLLPRKVEKWLGDHVMYPLATSYLFETSSCMPGGSTEQVKKHMNKLTARLVEKNYELLNPPGQEGFNYRVKTMKAGILNAFAVAGGGMVIYSDVILQVADAIKGGEILETKVALADGSMVTVDLSAVTLDDVLAALMAHETTHIASRHTCMEMLFDLLWYLFLWIQYLIIPYSDKIARLEESIKQLISLHRSRKNEYEADVAGVYMANRAAYNPLGALYLQAFFQNKESEYGAFFHNHFEFLNTHPHVENRKRSLFAAISSLAPERLLGRITQWESSDCYDLSQPTPAVQLAQKTHAAYLARKASEILPEGHGPEGTFCAGCGA